MKSEKQILESREAIRLQVVDKWAGVKKENRSPNQEEIDFFNKADADIIALTAERDAILSDQTQIAEIEQRIGKYESMAAEKATTPQEVRSVNNTLKNLNKPEFRAALDKYMRAGEGGITQEERSVLGQFEKRGTSTLISSTTTLGGYTMPEEWAKELYSVMLWYGGAMDAAGISYRSSGGGDLHLPKVNDSTAVGQIIGQATAGTVQDTTFSEVILSAFDYTSDIIKVGWDLVEDSAYDIVAEVQALAAARIGRILNTHFTTGDGSGKPLGLVPAASAGVTAASATAVTRAEIVRLMHSVDPAHRVGPKVGYMFNDAKLSAIKQLSFGSGDDRPLWQMSMREGAPDRLEGAQYWINNDMPASTTGLKSMLYGNFGAYKIRQVGGYTLARTTERYIDERALAFFLFCRFDADIINSAAIKYLIQA